MAEIEKHKVLAAEKAAKAAEMQEKARLREERERKCVGCWEDHPVEACAFLKWFEEHGGVRQEGGGNTLYLREGVKLFVRDEPIECAWVRSELWDISIGDSQRVKDATDTWAFQQQSRDNVGLAMEQQQAWNPGKGEAYKTAVQAL